MERSLLSVLRAESVTCTLNANQPPVVGTPEISPVTPSRDRPSGRLPAVIDQAYGGAPFKAVRVAL